MWRMICIVVVAFVLFAVAKNATSAELGPEPEQTSEKNWSLIDKGVGCAMFFRPMSFSEYSVSIVYVPTDNETMLGFTAPGVVYPPTDKIKNVKVILEDDSATELLPNYTSVYISDFGAEYISLKFADDITPKLKSINGLALYLESDVEMPTNGMYSFKWYDSPYWKKFSDCVKTHQK